MGEGLSLPSMCPPKHRGYRGVGGRAKEQGTRDVARILDVARARVCGSRR